jgi:hypothetical protein
MPREVRPLSQGHTARRWASWYVNLNLCDPKALVLSSPPFSSLPPGWVFQFRVCVCVCVCVCV